MLVSGPQGYIPIQKNNNRTVSTMTADRQKVGDGRFDSISLSAAAEPASSPDFRKLVASVSQQVRTYNTTGRVQELRSQVQSGQYQVSPSEIAARMLLLGEDMG